MYYLLISYGLAPFIWLYHRLWHTKPVRHILVVQTAKIGDMVCATPVIHALRTTFPQATLSVMATALTAPLLKANPDIDDTVIVDMATFKGVRGKVTLLRVLTRIGADTVLFLNPNLMFLLAAFWCGITRRLVVLSTFMGTTLRYASKLMTHIELHKEGELVHHAQQRLLKKIGVTLPNFFHYAYETGTAPLQLSEHEKWIGIGISTGNKLKELGQEKLAHIIQNLLAQTSYQIVLIGAHTDRAIAHELVALAPQRIKDSTGQIALEVLPQFLRRLSLYIGVDSGITYLADAVQVPVVSVIGPVDWREQGPMGKFVEIIRRDEPCAPCSRVFHTAYQCKIGTKACIEKIEASEITERALSLLHRVKGHKA
jgi:ADP-heptose:LPS heptosyltransferase